MHVLPVCVFPHRSPFPCAPLQFDGSAILGGMAPLARAQFLHSLHTFWLPRSKLTLLYRGSRDGMTPAAFHKRCDGKSPTLTLVQAHGRVFGGYTTAPWCSPDFRARGRCADSFLFAAGLGAGGEDLRLGLSPGSHVRATLSASFYGPCFGDGFVLQNGTGSPDFPFNACSQFCVGNAYQSTVDGGATLIPGKVNFTPEDVEVFLVGRRR